MPEKESDPPQLRPSVMRLAGSSLRSSAARASICSLMNLRAASTAPRVPPEFCRVMPMRRLLRGALGPR